MVKAAGDMVDLIHIHLRYPAGIRYSKPPDLSHLIAAVLQKFLLYFIDLITVRGRNSNLFNLQLLQCCNDSCCCCDAGNTRHLLHLADQLPVIPMAFYQTSGSASEYDQIGLGGCQQPGRLNSPFLHCPQSLFIHLFQ